MNTRLQQFLAAENISQSQFADTIGVARASVSHIVAGRNKPGFDFILGMAKAFPSLNVDWLITGKGKMYKGPEASVKVDVRKEEEDNLFSQEFFDAPETAFPTIQVAPEPVRVSAPVSPAKSPKTSINTSVEQPVRTKTQRNITRIVVFYDDNTFQELK